MHLQKPSVIELRCLFEAKVFECILYINIHSQKRKATKAVTGVVPFQKVRQKDCILVPFVPKECILVPQRYQKCTYIPKRYILEPF